MNHIFVSIRHTSLFLPLAVVATTSIVAAQDDVFRDVIQPAFRQSCIKCHGQGDKIQGKVNLHELKNDSDLKRDAELLTTIIEALESEVMPPEEQPPLAPEIRKHVVSHLKELFRAALRDQQTFPRTPIRRMNRFEYNNAVQDLFDLKVEVFALPERMMRGYGYFNPASGRMPDHLKVGSRPLGKSQLIGKRLAGVAPFPQDLRAEHGFDNRGDHLSLSPLLLESFLKLSRSMTDSPDFNEKTVGIWRATFAPPPAEQNQDDVVRDRLQSFLARAFRRPVNDQILDRYASHVISRIRSGESFTDAMQAAASAALASPRFLYLYDRASTGNRAELLDDFELASRLSFFLWSSIPDQILLDLAAQDALHQPEVLEAQVDRMLNDVRLKRFCDSFPAQWLQLERIVSSVPDPKRFSQFYFSKFRVSMHMMLEPLLLFETILVEDRSILELIDSDFSYRSDLLQSWYRDGSQAKTTPTAIPFHRVPLSDRRQGGVITNAAVMTMTSNPRRTQPITRGAWIATVIFNDPPEPPPADVPPLAEEPSNDQKDMTLRERFAAHRTRADCAGCHVKIDPLGFALENYDAVGVWRDRYENGRSVDAGGVLFRKHNFSNIVEFKDAILAEKDGFIRAFAAHLMSFALGRQVTAMDSPALDHIVRETIAADYRFRPLIRQIVLSEPFLRKYNPVKQVDQFP